MTVRHESGGIVTVKQVSRRNARSAAAAAGSDLQLLGVPIALTTEQGLLDSVAAAVTGNRSTVFVGLYAAQFRSLAADPDYRARVLASVVYPDGAGVVRELRRRGVADVARLATTDMVLPLAEQAARYGWRVGLYGAAPGIAEGAAAALQASIPGLRVVGVWDGYSGGPSEVELKELDLDMMFVGLGAPTQEHWAHDVAVVAGVPAVFTCGGLFDFLAGSKQRAPRWLQRLGLEWAFRVLLEPRRLFGRYLRGNEYFLRHARAERRSLTKN